MTPEVLQSITDQLTHLNSFFGRQVTSKTILEFPSSFEVTSEDGYSLGRFIIDDGTGNWVFKAYETLIYES